MELYLPKELLEILHIQKKADQEVKGGRVLNEMEIEEICKKIDEENVPEIGIDENEITWLNDEKKCLD